MPTVGSWVSASTRLTDYSSLQHWQLLTESVNARMANIFAYPGMIVAQSIGHFVSDVTLRIHSEG